MALNQYRLAHQADQKNRRAIILQRLIHEPDRLLGTILLGNNLVNNLAVSITTLLALKFYGEAGVAAATVLITIVILVVAEIPPKTMAAIYPERIAFFASTILTLLSKLFYPIVWVMSSVVKLIQLIPAFHDQGKSHSLDSNELRAAVQASEQHFTHDQYEMLLGILELGTQSVESVMVPRSEIQAIDLDDEISDIVEQILKSTHARLPVFDKSFGSIRGELEIRELLQRFKLENITKENLVSALKEPIYLPEDALLLEQIQRLQSNERNLGIVIDEYGEVVGLFSLFDLFAELAGVISGQFEGKIPGIVPQSDGSYLVIANMSVRDLNRLMKWNFPTEGPNTLNGLIIEQHEDIPQQGAVFEFNGHRVETIRVSGTSVDVARVYPEDQKSQDLESSTSNS